MLLPPGGLFSDSLFVDLDLQRLQDYYHSNAHILQQQQQHQQSSSHSLMAIVREPELLEQDLLPFSPAVTASIASLPPGKLPGVSPPTATTLSSLFADASVAFGVKQPPPPSTESPTKKRAKTEHITIEHF